MKDHDDVDDAMWMALGFGLLIFFWISNWVMSLDWAHMIFLGSWQP